MRHFREALCTRGITVHYRQLDEASSTGSLAKELTATVGRLCPQELVMVEAGEWRVQQAIKTAAQKMGMKLEIRSDRHFLCSREEFAAHAKGRKQFRLEFFSREMRRKTGVLMKGGRPVGGAWNFDAENRESFGKDGPGELPRPTERCFRSSPPWLRFHVLTPWPRTSRPRCSRLLKASLEWCLA